MVLRGKFISFEGIEGVGKTTQIARFKAFLEAHGNAVTFVREPGGTELGEDVRKILKFADYGERMSAEAEALLFSAARAQLVREKLLPALDSGAYILADRFTDSSVAYQGAGRGLGMEKIAAMNEFATGGLVPDFTVLLDLDPEIGFARTRSRAGESSDGKTDRMETFPRDFYERVRAAYLNLAERDPLRFFVVDASLDPDDVFEKIRDEYVRRFA
jgi:dTMP kinase